MANFEEEFEEEFETVVMIDDEGESISFSIIDNLVYNSQRYLLVIETEYIDDEESPAAILKEIGMDAENVTYALVEDDEEFDRVAELFAENDGAYDVEIEE